MLPSIGWVSSNPLWLGLALAVIVIACTAPPPPDATGEEVYVELCASCHGADLNGGVGPALGPGSNSANLGDDFLRLTIVRGRGRMPSFGSALSDDHVQRLIDYLREVQGR